MVREIKGGNSNLLVFESRRVLLRREDKDRSQNVDRDFRESSKVGMKLYYGNSI